MNFSSSVSKLKIARIIELCKKDCMNVHQISESLAINKRTASQYIKHLISSDGLVVNNKIGKINYYQSTGKYNYIDPGRKASVPIRYAPEIKPFRDSWTELFFGPVSKV